MRRGARLLWLPGVLLLSACAGSATSARSAEPSPSPSCDELLEQYRITLAAGTGGCSSDQDCVRYGGVDPQAVCGGTTDVETGRALTQIDSERDAAGCPRPGYSCPAIEPRCVDGTCR